MTAGQFTSLLGSVLQDRRYLLRAAEEGRLIFRGAQIDAYPWWRVKVTGENQFEFAKFEEWPILDRVKALVLSMVEFGIRYATPGVPVSRYLVQKQTLTHESGREFWPKFINEVIEAVKLIKANQLQYIQQLNGEMPPAPPGYPNVETWADMPMVIWVQLDLGAQKRPRAPAASGASSSHAPPVAFHGWWANPQGWSWGWG